MPLFSNIQQVTRLTGHKASVFALEPGPQPHTFLSGAGDGWVVEWDLRDPELGRLIAKVETQIFSMKLLSDKKRIVVGNMNGGVHWVNLEDPDQTRNIAHHQKGVFAIEEIRDVVLTLGGKGLLTRWNAHTGVSQESIHLSREALRCLAFCPEKNELAIGSSDHAIYLLDASSLEVKYRINQAHDNSVFSLAYSQDGQYLYSGGRDALLKVWDLDNGKASINSQPAHWFTINAIAHHPAKPLFATASRDKTIKIWDAQDFRLLKVLETVRDRGHLNSVNDLHWAMEGQYLLSTGDDRSIIVWEFQ